METPETPQEPGTEEEETGGDFGGETEGDDGGSEGGDEQ
jgi:hypothetical protein